MKNLINKKSNNKIFRIYDKYKDNVFEKVKEKNEIAGINYIYPYLTNNSVKSVLLSSVGFTFYLILSSYSPFAYCSVHSLAVLS